MDEDEELRRAIALSLEESNIASRRIQNPNEDEVEAQFQRDLEAAIEASKKESATENSYQTNRKESHVQKITVKSPQKPEPSSSSAFLSERSQLESERLQRLKRNRQESGTPSVNGLEADSPTAPPAKKARNTSSSQTQFGGAIQHNRLQNKGEPSDAEPSLVSDDKLREDIASPSNSKEKVDLFWNGELRQTANRFADNETRPIFRLSEIIGPKKDITLAIVSSYSNMIEWLHGFFDRKTPIILVHQPGEDGKAMVKEVASNMLVTMPFLQNGRGCMHIKLLLLFYKDGRLRVVIPTANFMDYDWRDIENSVWVQDVPMRKTTIRHDPKAKDFAGTLQRVLHNLNVPAALSKLLDGDNFPDLPIESISELRMRWVWSNVKAKLIVSLAGRHEGWDQVERTGHPALAVAIRELRAGPLPSTKDLELECQGSSIGMYTTQWMNEFYCSARGISARSWLDEPKKQRRTLSWPPIKVLFPSLRTVNDSILGTAGAMTMFCKKAHWEAKDFPRHLFYDSNSKRARVMMHSKMIVGIYRNRSTPNANDIHNDESLGKSGSRETKDFNTNLVGWTYVGSHNFTPSAWGTLSGSTANPVLNIVNYEMGIVIPNRSHAELEATVCWKRPARKYVDGVDRAWIQEEMQRRLL